MSDRLAAAVKDSSRNLRIIRDAQNMNELNVCWGRQKEAEVEKESRSKHHYICLFFITFRTFFFPCEFPVSASSTVKKIMSCPKASVTTRRGKKNAALLFEMKSK